MMPHSLLDVLGAAILGMVPVSILLAVVAAVALLVRS